jgi:hypothetical protein
MEASDMGMKKIVLLASVVLFVIMAERPCFSKNEIQLEVQSWPDSKKYEVCVPLQFGKLEMQLPISYIKKILVIGIDEPVLAVIPKEAEPNVNLLFLIMRPERLIGIFKSAGLLKGLNIETNEQFFDALGKLPVQNKSITTMRQIMDIKTAKQYTKTSKGTVHVYWIRSPHPGIRH